MSEGRRLSGGSGSLLLSPSSDCDAKCRKGVEGSVSESGYDGYYDLPARDTAYLCSLTDEYKRTGKQPDINNQPHQIEKEKYIRPEHGCWRMRWNPCAIGRLSENLYIMGNEPSQALYCIQEHVRKEVPNMIRQKNEFTTQHRLLQGTCYDCDYAIGAVKSIEKSQDRFVSIQNYLKNALFLRQQLKHEEARRKLQQRQKR